MKDYIDWLTEIQCNNLKVLVLQRELIKQACCTADMLAKVVMKLSLSSSSVIQAPPSCKCGII